MTDMREAIDRITRDVLQLPTLETRNSDKLDFHTLSVWQIHEALCAAYRAGINCAAGDDL